jgi:hypothetical protein
MRYVWVALASAIFGGAAFWLPNTFLVSRILDSTAVFATVTFACPLALLAAYTIVIWSRKGTVAGPSSALFALIGVWVTGPWLMALSAGLAEGDAVHKLGSVGYGSLLLMTVFPPLTLYFSSMQGNVFALLLVTVLMPICHRFYEKGRWIIPPTWKRRIRLGRSRSTG